MEDNKWKCKYCDKLFPKEGNWETHQKCTFTEPQMKSLGKTYLDMNDTSPVKETKWFQHLDRIPGTDFVTCKKRRSIECYMGGKVFKFDTRSGWQKHIERHHNNEPFIPVYSKKKERRTKLEMTIDKQVRKYINTIKGQLTEGHKITNIKVDITWDSEAPPVKVKNIDKAEKLEAIAKEKKKEKFDQITKQLEFELKNNKIV